MTDRLDFLAALAHMVFDPVARKVVKERSKCTGSWPRIGQREIGQIKTYAQAVADDPQFRDVKTDWEFWLATADMSPVARMESRQTDRLHYYRDQFEHDPSVEQANEYLNLRHRSSVPISRVPLTSPAGRGLAVAR